MRGRVVGEPGGLQARRAAGLDPRPVPDLLAAAEPKVEPKRVLPVAILVGMALEGLKYVNLFVWPFLQRKLDQEYSVFQHSVTILLWAFVVA